MEKRLENARKLIGKFVVLNAVGLRNREEKMRNKEGIVVGVKSYQEKVNGFKRELIHYRCLVEWDHGKPWAENPDNLKVIVKESEKRSFSGCRLA